MFVARHLDIAVVLRNFALLSLALLPTTTPAQGSAGLDGELRAAEAAAGSERARRLAKVAWRLVLDDPGRALELARRCLEILRRHPDETVLGDTHMVLARVHRIRHELGEAVRWAESAVASTDRHGDAEARWHAQYEFASCLSDLGRHDEAIAVLERLPGLVEGLEPELGLGAQLALGRGYMQRHDYERALDTLLEAEQFADRLLADRVALPDTLVANVHNEVGSIFYFIGHQRRALRSYARAGEIWGRISPRLQSIALQNMGGSHYELGEFEQALRQQQRALAIVEPLQDRASIGMLETELSMTLLALGRGEQALAHAANGERVLTGTDPGSPLALAIMQHALCRALHGDGNGCDESMARALEIAGATADADVVRRVHHAKSRMHAALGDTEAALLHLTRHVELEREQVAGNRERWATLTARYETAAKTRTIELLESRRARDLERLQAEHGSLRLALWSGCGLLLLAVFTGLAWWRKHAAMRRLSLAHTELRRTHAELVEQRALASERGRELETLKGLLPICAACKSIRDDDGSWSQLEAYIQAHSPARFTHGLCPDCEDGFMSTLERPC